MRQPDFLVVGAQKSGTTSLFMYLRAHPRLYLPLQKEIGFFADDALFGKGFDWYIKTYFSDVSEGTLSGEVSPQYMYSTSVPGRIKAHLPNVKIIAILRNPIDRAYSHYRMAVRRSKEQKTFSEAIREKALRGVVADSRIDPDTEYYNFGLYHRVLKEYLGKFPAENIFITFQEDLDKDPGKVVMEVCRFLGVEPIVPPNAGKRYHESGSQRSQLVDKLLKKPNAVKKILKHLLPFKTRQSIKFWIEQINIKKKADVGPCAQDRKYAREIFAADVALLKKDFRVTVPWDDFK